MKLRRHITGGQTGMDRAALAHAANAAVRQRKERRGYRAVGGPQG